MHRLSIYRIELSKNEFSTTLVSMTLRWRVTDGEIEGEGRITRFVSRTLINQSKDCQRTYIGRTTLKESVNHPLTVRVS